MTDSLNQALVGTDAIKAFLTQFDSLDDEIKRVVVEELLLCLINEGKNDRKSN
jgi:hypothetical protein